MFLKHIVIHGLTTLSLTGILLFHVPTYAQSERDNQQSKNIAATVDGTAIYIADINRLVQRFPTKPQDEQHAAGQQAVALEQLIHRRLVCVYLENQGMGATTGEIDLEQESLEIELEQRQIKLKDYLSQQGLSLDSLRQTWQWQIGWRKYLKRYMTEENLQRYFDQNKRNFDGTQLKVSHLLIKVEQDADQKTWDETTKKVNEIRDEIVSGKKTWNQAVAEYSQATSADENGDAGWIGFQRPMPRDFTDAAFALDSKQISQPVKTAFGVHLLKITDIKPGNATWRDVRDQLERAATRFLFDRIVNSQKGNSKIEFTGNTPYFEIDTGKLIRPGK